MMSGKKWDSSNHAQRSNAYLRSVDCNAILTPQTSQVRTFHSGLSLMLTSTQTWCRLSMGCVHHMDCCRWRHSILVELHLSQRILCTTWWHLQSHTLLRMWRKFGLQLLCKQLQLLGCHAGTCKCCQCRRLSQKQSTCQRHRLHMRGRGSVS